jgi:tripartite-type tricarboxylate transporter receptor subunit TctC
VHFRATGDAMTAILSGAVQGMFGSIAVVLPQVRAGKLKALAVTGPLRAAMLPAVPTMAELGHAQLTISAWFGLVAPAAAPVAVLRAVEAEVLRAVATPALAGRLVEAGFRVSSQGSAGFAALMQRETARWAEVVRETGFRAIE